MNCGDASKVKYSKYLDPAETVLSCSEPLHPTTFPQMGRPATRTTGSGPASAPANLPHLHRTMAMERFSGCEDLVGVPVVNCWLSCFCRPKGAPR